MVDPSFLAIIGKFIAQWGMIIILVCFSGMFSGLNLGLMSLDKVLLEIVIGSGTANESKYARRIYPIRRRGNLLLCTILLGNVAVNALLSIILADLTSGFMGFILSTAVIVIFGEITPQAICSRHGLAVGYYTVWIVWAFEIALLPLSYPISKILDLILGREIGTIYSRKELKKLLEIHASHQATDLSAEETTILTGALDFGSKNVDEIMTPIDQVYMVSIDDELDVDTISTMLSKGYSRIPVYKGQKDNIVGLLFVKDLALLNPHEKTPIRKVLPLYGRNFPRVFGDTKLSDMLKEFKAGQSHIAVVRRVNNTGDGDPFYENTGVVTLEDVIEEILQQEIIDETDVYVDNRSMAKVNRGGVDYKVVTDTIAGKETHEHVEYAFNKLSRMPEFSGENISPSVLKKLISQCAVSTVDDQSPSIFQKGKPSSNMVLVLEGSLSTGSSSIHAGDCYGVDAVRDDGYVAQHTVSAEGHAKILTVSRRAYTAAKQATLLSDDRDDEEVDDF